VNTGQSLRITGLTFKAGTTTAKYNGAIRVGGNSNQVRLDQLHFTNLYHTNYIAIYGNTYGVADHVVEDNIPSQLGQNRAYNGEGAGGYGDEVWAQPAGYGGPNFFFFEDWYVNNNVGGPFSASGGWDALIGGKFVIRHCHLYDVEILCHGTEGMRQRGGRAQEIYNNDYHWSYSTGMDGVRSGTLVVHDNTYHGVEPGGYGLQTYRMIFGYNSIWEGATGFSAWDINGANPNESGTVTATHRIDAQHSTITDRSKNWTPGQWVNFEASNPANGDTFLVTANNTNTLTLLEWGDGCCPENWSVGDTYRIGLVLQALDQPGAGQGDVLTGDNPPPHWIKQVREGCYSWDNIYTPNGHHINWQPSSPNLLEGRDFFSDTPLPGYSPYTYPHPLVTGTGTPTPTPTGTPTPTPTGTPAPTPSATPTAIPSPTSTATVTPTTTPSATVSPTPGPTATPTPSATATPVPGGSPPTDFNGDGHPDWVIRYVPTGQTMLVYMNNNVAIGADLGPALPNGWVLSSVADFNGDGHPDYALFIPGTGQTVIGYLSGPTVIGAALGPTLPSGWELVATANFNNGGRPDYVLYNANTQQTAVWYLNNNVLIGVEAGPTLPNGWTLIGVADFDRDGHPDYALFHPSSGYTAICYLSGPTLVGAAWGPTVPSGWVVVATADFDGDGHPDYLLYKPSTGQTAIWYLNNNVYVGAANGPTLPAGWILATP